MQTASAGDPAPTTEPQAAGPGLESVFGPADGPHRQALARSGSIVSSPCDIAAIHRLSATTFAFQSLRSFDLRPSELQVNVLLVARGQARLDQMKQTVAVGPGDIAVFSNWGPFHLSASDVDALVLTIPGWWGFKHILPTSLVRSDMLLPADLFCTPALHVLAQGLFDLDPAQGQGNAAIGLFGEMLRGALGIVIGDREDQVAPTGRIGRIFSFICQNLAREDLAPHDAAAALRCSLRTIHKTCADHGTSFNSLLIDVRLSAAAYDLSASDRRVSDVAYASGFGSLSHFCRLFKARFGESATGYRKRYLLQ